MSRSKGKGGDADENWKELGGEENQAVQDSIFLKYVSGNLIGGKSKRGTESRTAPVGSGKGA